MDIAAIDKRYIWHPCTQMKDHEDFPIIAIDKGKGVYLYDIYGNKILDAISSWWVNLFGHSNERINNVLKEQLEKLEHVIFAGFTHEPAAVLVENIIKIMPDNIRKVFFADNGSSAVEVALKMSFQYWQQSGKVSKTKFVALKGGYHGETLGALSVGGIDLYKKIYNPLLLETFYVDALECFNCKYGKNRNNCTAECIETMEAILSQNHLEIAAVIIEPMVQCANGMNIYSPIYLKKLSYLCQNFNIHLIADEIAVGFGRSGKMFAFEHAQIKPDIICLSKGLTGGYLPLSLVLTTNEIYNAFYDDYFKSKAFLHSHSYTGNPLACSAACETLKIFRDENILIKNLEKIQKMYNILFELFCDHPNVGEIRQLGMIAALEILEDKENKIKFDPKLRIGFQIYKYALSKGLLIRPLGDVIYFMPPYIIDDDEIYFMIKTTKDSLDKIIKQRGKKCR